MELGVGGFGVVLSTDDPQTVVKLTTDRSEAQFAAASIAYDLRAKGVVGYSHAVRLQVDLQVEGWADLLENPIGFGYGPPITPMQAEGTGTVPMGDGFPIYALWRQRATKIGEGPSVYGYDGEIQQLLGAVERGLNRHTVRKEGGGWKKTGAVVAPSRPLPVNGAILPTRWTALTEAAWAVYKEERPGYEERAAASVRAGGVLPWRVRMQDELAEQFLLAGGAEDFPWWGAPNQAQAVAASVAAGAMGLLEASEVWGEGAVPGALRRYLDEWGIVFGDVGDNNIGKVGRAWALVDPGKAVFLTSRYRDADALLEEGVGGTYANPSAAGRRARFRRLMRL